MLSYVLCAVVLPLFGASLFLIVAGIAILNICRPALPMLSRVEQKWALLTSSAELED